MLALFTKLLSNATIDDRTNLTINIVREIPKLSIPPNP